LALGSRDSDHYQGLDFPQIVRDSKVKICKTFLIEFFVQQALLAVSFDLFLQMTDVFD
jgi:hypothetical protein